MNWLTQTIQDNNGRFSSKRVSMLWASLSLGISMIILSIGAILTDKDLSMALGAVAVPLAGLGGYSYVNGSKANEQAKGE